MIGGQAGKTVIHDIPDRATAEAVVEARRASFEAAIETQLNRLREGK
ncbi:hypothetical protein KQX64_06985 [Rhodopseudomonas palustris]|nr:hypothetical protein KQX64_06985 [Rhodopseudomonas palustris]